MVYGTLLKDIIKSNALFRHKRPNFLLALMEKNLAELFQKQLEVLRKEKKVHFLVVKLFAIRGFFCKTGWGGPRIYILYG